MCHGQYYHAPCTQNNIILDNLFSSQLILIPILMCSRNVTEPPIQIHRHISSTVDPQTSITPDIKQFRF